MQNAPEPLSWLTLERYALGELSAEERAEVEARLLASEVDRACLAEIVNDKSELPDLPATSRPAVSALADARARRKTPWLVVSAALCAAAAALLVVLNRPISDLPAIPDGSGDHVKGSDVSLRLISDRQGKDPTRFGPGERFKVELSCPPSLSAALRLFVVQDGELFEPLPRDASFRCGNLAPWPGAFALDGDKPADVCAYWGSAEQPTREELTAEAACRRLEAP